MADGGQAGALRKERRVDDPVVVFEMELGDGRQNFGAVQTDKFAAGPVNLRRRALGEVEAVLVGEGAHGVDKCGPSKNRRGRHLKDRLAPEALIEIYIPSPHRQCSFDQFGFAEAIDDGPISVVFQKNAIDH